MPTEKELLFQISRVVSLPFRFERAVERIARILERIGGRTLLIELPGSTSNLPEDIQTFLASFETRYKSFYSVALLDGGETIGRAVLCFASDQFPGDVPRRVSTFVGEQPGMLLRRERLAETRASLEDEIRRLREEFATRKALSRAEGLLVDHHGLSSPAAKAWLIQQTRKSGMSLKEVAERLVECRGESTLLGSLRGQRIA
jgi:hypothetical protein